MDGLSVAASVVAVIQISSQIFDVCRTYYMAVKEARSDIQRLRNEVTSLQDVLVNVADLADAPGSGTRSTLGLLTQPEGPVQQCHDELLKLLSILDPGQGKNAMMKFGLRALKWPLSTKDVDKVLRELERHKATFNLALAADNMALALAINKSVAELSNQFEAHRIDDRREKIIRWLSMTDPSSNHYAACKKHYAMTGDWFIQGDDFRKWKQTQNSLLWLHGIPGCGKTILSSTIIEHLKSHCDLETAVALTYFYFDFDDPLKQNALCFLSSIFAQLCNQASNLPDLLEQLYEKCNKGQHKPAVSDLKSILSKVEGEFHGVFIVIDALDECPKGGEREAILELLKLFRSWSSSSVHILVTSRQETDIEEALLPYLTNSGISIQGFHVDLDIELHVSNQLVTDPKLNVWPNEVRIEIVNALVKGANGMFRWVFCQLDALKKCLKVSAIRKALTNLPKTLDETYERILTNIDEDYQQEAFSALMWLAYSERPLQMKELIEAMAINPQSDPPFDPEERLPDARNVLRILGSLVTVTPAVVKHPLRNLSNDRISLAHFSVKEFLQCDRILSSSAKKYKFTKTFANQFIAESSLRYIIYYAESSNAYIQDTLPLLQYACEFWHRHTKPLPLLNQEQLLPIMLRLFNSDTALRKWIHIYRPYDQYLSNFHSGSSLHYASESGILSLVQRLLLGDVEVDAKNQIGETSLHWAAKRGHEAIAKILLNKGADVHARSENGQTPLQLAALGGFEAVARLLLDFGAEVDSRDNEMGTPLHAAVYHNGLNRGTEVAKLLLEHGAHIEAKDEYGRTALHWAAYRDNDDLMNWLVENGADVNARNRGGETALHYAARDKDTATLQQLLILGAEVDAQTYHYERTALHWAASDGQPLSVALLLENGANIEATSKDGETPLSLALRNGHDNVVEFLVQMGASDPL